MLPALVHTPPLPTLPTRSPLALCHSPSLRVFRFCMDEAEFLELLAEATLDDARELWPPGAGLAAVHAMCSA